MLITRAVVTLDHDPDALSRPAWLLEAPGAWVAVLDPGDLPEPVPWRMFGKVTAPSLAGTMAVPVLTREGASGYAAALSLCCGPRSTDGLIGLLAAWQGIPRLPGMDA